MAIKTNESYAYWLQPLNASGIPGKKSRPRTVNALGPDGSSDDGPPGFVSFTPFVDKYGLFSIENIAVQNNLNIEGATEIHCVVYYVDEVSPGDGVSLPAVNDTDLTLTWPGGGDAGVHDYVLINDSSNASLTAENSPPPVWGKFARNCLPDDDVIYVVDATGFPTAGPFDIYFRRSPEGMRVIQGQGSNVWTVDRSSSFGRFFYYAGDDLFWYPTGGTAGDPIRKYEIGHLELNESLELVLERKDTGDSRPGRASLNSYMTAHASGKKVYLVKVRHFSMAIRKDALVASVQSVSGLPQQMDMVLPSACVCACSVALKNYYGYGPWTTVNVSEPYSEAAQDNPPSPGLRTLSGGAYIIPINGDLEVVSDGPVMRIQDSASIRCIYGEVETAPTGASLIVHVHVKAPTDVSWTEIESFTISAGAKLSYDASSANIPSARSMPFVHTWPTPVLLQDGLLMVSISQVGSTVAGANLRVYVQT